MGKSNYKFVIVVDSNETPGNVTALVADATVDMFISGEDISREEVNWVKDGKNNVILCADTELAIVGIMVKCLQAGIRVIPITRSVYSGIKLDDGKRTIQKRDAVRAIAIGPVKSHLVDKITGNIPLY